MRINETDKAVAAYLKAEGVEYSVIAKGTSKPWDSKTVADAYSVAFSKNRDMVETDFYTGIYHREVLKDGKGVANTIKEEYKAMGLPVPRLINTQKHGEEANERRLGWMDKVYVPYPTAASVLYCLLSDARCGEQNFYDFCDEMGYDSDSRKALATHDTCAKLSIEMRRVFSAAQREQLEELLQDY